MPSIDSRYPPLITNPNTVIVSGSVAPNGSSAPTTQSGRGFSIARVSEGLGRITFNQRYGALLSAQGTVELAAASQQKASIVFGPYNASSRTLDFYCYKQVPGWIPLDIFSAREIISNNIGVAADAAARGSGGILCSDTTPVLERVNGATDKAVRISWATGNSDEIQFPPMMIPPDYDGGDITFYARIGKGSNTDTEATVALGAWQGIGDSDFGGTLATLDTASVVNYGLSLAAADITGPLEGAAAPISFQIIPGTHANDTIQLYGAWIEYTRRLLTDISADANNRFNFTFAFQSTSGDSA